MTSNKETYELIYKGFVPTKNKRCLKKFKDAPLMSYEEVCKLDEFAGIIRDDVILIDIDDAEQAGLMMDIVEDLQLDCVVMKTSRGRHFYFKNNFVNKCYTGTKLACGLTADIKVGSHNSYAVAKFNGEERVIEWDWKEIKELPCWMRPVKSNLNLFDMQEGDGRNQALFSYILTLTSAGFSKDESRECLKIINDYIFSVPLSDSELETIMRDEAFPTDSFFEKNKFLHDKFADFLMRNDYIIRLNGQLHIYKDGVYVPALREIEARMIKHIPFLKSQQRQEALKYIDLKAETKEVANARFIAFANGVYDITTEELLGFSPDMIITNKIPWNYNEKAYSEIADKTLNKIACNDKSIRHLLEECIGYCFYRRNELSKFFVLTGGGANGKSTFLDMVKNLLGQDNITSLDLNDLDERFSIGLMAGALANIGDDISDEFMQGKSIALLKKIVSGNQVKGEFKGKDAFFFNPYIKLLFSANDIPRTKDKTGAVLRRLVIIPFNAHFSKHDADYDPYITYKLMDKEVMEYLVQIGLDGLFDVLNDNGFTESKIVNEAIQEYEEENNPIILFLKNAEVVGRFTKDVYLEYQVFCTENHYTSYTLTSFTRQLKQRLGVKVKKIWSNGKTCDMYVE